MPVPFDKNHAPLHHKVCLLGTFITLLLFFFAGPIVNFIDVLIYDVFPLNFGSFYSLLLRFRSDEYIVPLKLFLPEESVLCMLKNRG